MHGLVTGGEAKSQPHEVETGCPAPTKTKDLQKCGKGLFVYPEIILALIPSRSHGSRHCSGTHH